MILMYRELSYYSWILWCFSPSTLLWWIEFSPLKLSYRIESLRIWEHLMYVLPCLSVVTMGYHVIHLMYVLVINLRVSWPRELIHRVWHTFLSWLSGRNFGALFEILCVGWIDEYEIVWCISYNHTPRILEVTLEYLGDIRVLVDLCLKVLF